MSLMRRNLVQIWEQLRAKKPQFKQFLESLRIQNLRGIADLTIPFTYPVTVVAGPNGCGKSTVLFACACAYEVAGKRDYSPAFLFPNLKPQNAPGMADLMVNPSFEYHFIEYGVRPSMTWRRLKSWSRSFMGRKSGKQPQRALYLRTLANLTSPTEVRSILQIGNRDFTQEELDADLIAFAHRVMPFKYQSLQLLKFNDKELLFAQREDTSASYSEFHMSAGERALLRISKDISRLQGALILIDEVEAGLHPYTQQQVMLELQRLALRNDLQIIVTSHSPVILESVPPEARLFLERVEGDVKLQPPYRDIFQRAFYGRPQNRLSILCEDSVAEALILGVLERINPELNLTPDDVSVGRDTGKDLFPQHVEALGKFGLLDAFVFVLDGDARSVEGKLIMAAERYNRVVKPLFLPGRDLPPEAWIYQTLEKHGEAYAQVLGAPNFVAILQQLRQQFDNAADTPTNIAKSRYVTLAEDLHRTPEELARMVGRIESARGDMKVFADELRDAISNWRSRSIG
ncbi:MAG: AAA family ATPase [Magnetococcales bacterium]|nr:AAA family ATPase [Magnetococcales bacterium]